MASRRFAFMQQGLYANFLQKYNIPVPRYTSYPTVPYWATEAFSLYRWKYQVRETYSQNRQKGISLYLHLPFCESMCTFCGCNKYITGNHGMEMPYLQALLREWRMYYDILGEKPLIRELHLGGGTPSFFAPHHLDYLITQLLRYARLDPEAELGFEGHPNNTTRAHLLTLARLGFKRVSFGVQDVDENVQAAINRMQPEKHVRWVTQWARDTGYRSVNFDLVYGLPFQTMQSVEHTLALVEDLKPDRIAYYSYAHVPWLKGIGQRKFSEADLPGPAYKRRLYEAGRELLLDRGYVEIGMDHFSLPTDDLYLAAQHGRLHRNFMGYTTSSSPLLIGLGVSSISDAASAYAQNEKQLKDYYRALDSWRLPVFRGHHLSLTDRALRKMIMDLICRDCTHLQSEALPAGESDIIRKRLEPAVKDGLVIWEGDLLKLTEKGKPFVRTVCLAFDRRYWASQPDSKTFSMAI